MILFLAVIPVIFSAGVRHPEVAIATIAATTYGRGRPLCFTITIGFG